MNGSINSCFNNSNKRLTYTHESNYKLKSTDELLYIVKNTNPFDTKSASLVLNIIRSFCKLNKIKIEDCEEICNILFQMISSNIIQKTAFGFACFSNIFLCSKFKFPLSLLPKVMNIFFKMIDYSNYTLIHTILYICVKLSGESIQHSQVIAKYFDLETLTNLIQIDNKSIQHKTLYLIGNICSSINLKKEYAEFICEITNHIIEIKDIELLPEAIWCFECFMKQYFKWKDVQDKYNILTKLNNLLKDTNEQDLISEILSVIEFSYKCSIGFEIFDLEYLIKLMMFPSCSTQVLSIKCLLELIRNDNYIIDKLIEYKLFSSIEYIMINGTFKGKHYAFVFIDELLDIYGSKITEYLQQINLIYYLFDMFSSESDKTILTCLHVLSSLIHYTNIEQIGPFIDTDALYNLVESNDSLISEKAQMIIDEIVL